MDEENKPFLKGYRKFIFGYTLLIMAFVLAILNNPLDPAVLEFVKWLLIIAGAIAGVGNIAEHAVNNKKKP